MSESHSEKRHRLYGKPTEQRTPREIDIDRKNRAHKDRIVRKSKAFASWMKKYHGKQD